MADEPTTPPPRTMQCMEVWGGNGAGDNGVTMPGLDAWVLARPYEGQAEGGDIHYVSSCGTGRISRVLVADVSGHGRQVADLAVALRNMMRRYVNYVDQTRLVERMNREFAAMEQSGRFATAVVATFWAPTDYLVACNAGHPPPIAYSGRHRSWQVLRDESPGEPAGGEPTNLPLGIIDESRYEQFAVRLRSGDLVVFYSDALIEARLPDGRELGERGLLDAARTLDPSDGASFARRLYDEVVRRCGGAEPKDDVTILVMRPNGLKPRPTIGQRFGSPLRFLRLLAAKVRPGAAPVPWPEVRLENLMGPFSRRINERWGRGAPDLRSGPGPGGSDGRPTQSAGA
ncbi:MAG: serine/threonine-protein phosphatase [Phycisphaeraceae bacterium]|nr:serine/threonine-protein phosphatase [Phycisphaeraceae bacterium]